jgi:SAM-dependent methyltransferase
MATAASHRASPERIFNVLNAFQQTAALKSAIELDIFTAIAEGAQEYRSIAERVKASPRGVRILCDYLVVLGFLTKDEGHYLLSEESTIFLNRRSPAYVGTMIGFLTQKWHTDSFARLTDAVRRGGTANEDGDNTKPGDEKWVAFARAMAPIAVPNAQFISQLLDAPSGKPCRVLDIAAGHGMYGITLAKQNPNAQVTALDWPAVLEAAKENAQKHGVAERYALRPGSAFEAEMGTEYDYVLLTNIFHHFDVPTCEQLMQRVHTALKPGGKAVTLEFIPNEDRVTPPTAAGFSLVMLASTDAGDAYTYAEYAKMFSNAGFGRTTEHPVPNMPQTVLISEK